MLFTEAYMVKNRHREAVFLLSGHLQATKDLRLHLAVRGRQGERIRI